MAPIAVFIAGEKLLPWPAAARRIVAVLMLALGLGAAFVPAEVPGFAEPDGGNARRKAEAPACRECPEPGDEKANVPVWEPQGKAKRFLVKERRSPLSLAGHTADAELTANANSTQGFGRRRRGAQRRAKPRHSHCGSRGRSFSS